MDTEDVSSELDIRGYRLQFLDETPRIQSPSVNWAPNKTSSRSMAIIKCLKREKTWKIPEIQKNREKKIE
ncbi:hypothetical protein TNCV_3565381 [Trichonephila clavipes]|nr:hypothetical protein TNCV_3565381 [Trichonephila clavipes]